MEKSHLKLPFRLGATSMVFGDDLLENAGLLVSMVDNIEIILFHTPTLHNIPTTEEIHALKKICEEEDVTFTVHLPASLEVAAPERERRMKSVQLDLEAKGVIARSNTKPLRLYKNYQSVCFIISQSDGELST